MDIVDRAQHCERQTIDVAIANARNSLLAEPGRGVCLACGERIPKRRLEAVPGARYCLNCQTELEGTP